jgi:hypothetical protein
VISLVKLLLILVGVLLMKDVNPFPNVRLKAGERGDRRRVNRRIEKSASNSLRVFNCLVDENSK